MSEKLSEKLSRKKISNVRRINSSSKRRITHRKKDSSKRNITHQRRNSSSSSNKSSQKNTSAFQKYLGFLKHYKSIIGAIIAMGIVANKNEKIMKLNDEILLLRRRLVLNNSMEKKLADEEIMKLNDEIFTLRRSIRSNQQLSDEEIIEIIVDGIQCE